MVSPFAIRLAITSVETAGAVAGRFYALSTAGSLARHVPAGARSRSRSSARSGRCSPRPRCSRSRRRSCSAGGRSSSPRRSPRSSRCRPGAIKAERRAAARGGVALPVHPGGRARRRPAAAPPERGRRRRTRSGGADTVLTGGVWDAFLALPPLLDRPAAVRRHPRQRGRHDRARARRLLSGGDDRRRRDRPGREPRRAALLRHGRQPAADRARRGRAARSCAARTSATT